MFFYLLHPHPQLQNNIKNINMKNNILLSPQPHPPNRFPKNPPLLQLQSHPQFLTSSCIIQNPFLLVYYIHMILKIFLLQFSLIFYTLYNIIKL